MASYGVQLKDKNGNKVYPSPYWPIGSIYISVTNTNPGTIFGGTWVAFATGQCLVGVDTSQTEFNTVLKTGGNKNMQSHTHTTVNAGSHGHTVSLAKGAGSNANYFLVSGIGNVDASTFWTGGYTSTNGDHGHTINSSGTGNAQNLQPYITVYMWRRTA